MHPTHSSTMLIVRMNSIFLLYVVQNRRGIVDTTFLAVSAVYEMLLNMF